MKNPTTFMVAHTSTFRQRFDERSFAMIRILWLILRAERHVRLGSVDNGSLSAFEVTDLYAAAI
jgi:hypothetical protein